MHELTELFFSTKGPLPVIQIVAFSEQFSLTDVIASDQTVNKMTFNLWDFLRFSASPEKKKALFANDKEAYDFCRRLYKDSGGVTPELRRAYEFYQKNLDDECREPVRPSTGKDHAATV